MQTLFVKEDWEKYRTLEGLSAVSGVSPNQIASVVLKELVDNALDISGNCAIEPLTDTDNGFYVQDFGPGIGLERVNELFSISRPQTSSKFIRLPTRGVLGGGLKIVTGAVLATGGTLKVCTKGKTLELTTNAADGRTKSKVIGPFKGEGTRIEVTLGPEAGPTYFEWANLAMKFSNNGQQYEGKTSPWWYTAKDFQELCISAKGITIRDLISHYFAGADDRHIAQITMDFGRKQASEISLGEAKTLIERMRSASKPVKTTRLGRTDIEDLGHYAKVEGTFESGSNSDTASIPYVIECWAKHLDYDENNNKDRIQLLVNRTPIVGESLHVHRDKAEFGIFGCNLWGGPKTYEPIEGVGRKPVDLYVSIITPYMPVLSSGKSPNLEYFGENFSAVIEKAIKKANRNRPKSGKLSQIQVIRDHLDEQIRILSDDFRYIYSLRQLFYRMRPIVKKETGEAMNYDPFAQKITTIENEQGHDLRMMYRDDRGVIYHPHTHETIPLGTRMVEKYAPPDWTYNKLLYIEKQGLFQALIDEEWPDKHDCSLVTAKGQATRAAKDLIDKIEGCKEQITVYCIHDADASGSVIYEALRYETDARGARNIEIVNLGLESWEAVENRLEVEEIERLKNDRPVADYVNEYTDEHFKEDGTDWREWLQTRRVELNEMITSEFLDWIERKMCEAETEAGLGKLIPPEDVQIETLHEKVREDLKKEIEAQILKEQDAEGQIQKVYDKLLSAIEEKTKGLNAVVIEDLKNNPTHSWSDPVLAVARDLAMEKRST